MDDDFDDDDRTVETYVSRRREPEPSRSRAAGGASAYGDGFEHGPRVLWGRVAVLLVALLFVFLLGRACAPEGVPQSRLEEVQQELAETKAALEEERNREPAAQPTTPAAAPSPTVTPGSSPAAEPRTQTYTVKPGDTLRGISLKLYGTTAHAKFLQDANQISDAGSLRVGQKLTIPPEPSPGATPGPSPTTTAD